MKALNRVLTILSITLLSSVCFAGSWLSGAKDGVAIQGYDPVAYFTQKNAIKGSAKNNHEWGGTVWFFDTPENRELFAADPEKYAPQYGGHCALSVANGQNANGSGQAWTMRDGKLYLNSSKEAQSRWLQNVSQNIYWVDREWPKIKTRLAAE